MVVLSEEFWAKRMVEALKDEGLVEGQLQSYFSDRDRQGLEAYLKKPQGVLCTHPMTFSGLECKLLIWIADGYKGRSTILRAVETAAVVSPDGYAAGLTPGSVNLDISHAKCIKKEGPFTCSSCKVQLCRNCAEACHQKCSMEGGRSAVTYKFGLKCQCQSQSCLLATV